MINMSHVLLVIQLVAQATESIGVGRRLILVNGCSDAYVYTNQ